MKNSYLSSLKVVEIASVLAGPSVGMFFAEAGAIVIKFENKLTKGDVTRSWKLDSEERDSKVSAYFSSVNYKKKYLFIDFNVQSDYKLILEEIKSADIVITNFKKGDATKFRLDYQTLKQINSRLIYGEISGFGAESDRVAYDLILQAETGFMSINGTEKSGPVKMPVALIDILAGHQLKEGILVALLERMKTKNGCKVHVSLYDSAVSSLANQASNWLTVGINPQRMGSKHPNIAPYGDIYNTKDQKQITLAIGSDKQFHQLCKFLDLQDIILDERFSDNQSRVKNRVELEKIIAEKIATFSSEEIVRELNKIFVPVAIIKSVQEVFLDRAASELVREEIINGQLTRRVTGSVFKISN